MLEKLLEFLRVLEIAIPPRDHHHHTLSRALYGSDETSWDARLCLRVFYNPSGTAVLFLEVGDLERPPAELVNDIKKLVEASPDMPPLGSYR